jgi:hypothetical protein
MINWPESIEALNEEQSIRNEPSRLEAQGTPLAIGSAFASDWASSSSQTHRVPT